MRRRPSSVCKISEVKLKVTPRILSRVLKVRALGEDAIRGRFPIVNVLGHSFPPLIPALMDGRFDTRVERCTWRAKTITEERLERLERRTLPRHEPVNTGKVREGSVLISWWPLHGLLEVGIHVAKKQIRAHAQPSLAELPQEGHQ